MNNPYPSADTGGAVILVAVLITLGFLLQSSRKIPQNKSTPNGLTKLDTILLIFAFITAVVFSVLQEKILSTVEYIYLLCLMPPILFWWILDPEKKQDYSLKIAYYGHSQIWFSGLYLKN
jgi:Ca2+/Na+ antiporter